jgi:hypothetical protein
MLSLRGFSHFCIMINKPYFALVAALFVALAMVLVSWFFSVPIYDGIYTYKQKLVAFQIEQKVALPHLLGIHMETATEQGIVPQSVRLKPIGYVLLLLIHFGLPVLVYLRYYFARLKQRS